MDNFSPWGNNTHIPLEDALKLELPTQRCYVYRVDVGGQTYIGMTTQDPETAAASHVEKARGGETAKLHKALRRFGYVYDLTTLSEHDTEVDCLVAKVTQIQRLKPALNSTFGGEGNRFNLIELPNKLGEQTLHVENKQLYLSLLRVKQKSDPAYLKSMLERIRRRFEKFEHKLPHEHTRFADDLWEVSSPSSNLLGSRLTRQDVFDYAVKRYKRHALLKNWSDETRKIANDYQLATTFARANDFKILTKDKAAIFSHGTVNGQRRSYANSYEGDYFNPEFFKGVERVFFAERRLCLTDQVFADYQTAEDWLVQQNWFRSAIRDGFLAAGDAFYPVYIYLGRYGGFLGMFTKVNYRPGYVVVDQRLLSN